MPSRTARILALLTGVVLLAALSGCASPRDRSGDYGYGVPMALPTPPPEHVALRGHEVEVTWGSHQGRLLVWRTPTSDFGGRVPACAAMTTHGGPATYYDLNWRPRPFNGTVPAIHVSLATGAAVLTEMGLDGKCRPLLDYPVEPLAPGDQYVLYLVAAGHPRHLRLDVDHATLRFVPR